MVRNNNQKHGNGIRVFYMYFCKQSIITKYMTRCILVIYIMPLCIGTWAPWLLYTWRSWNQSLRTRRTVYVYYMCLCVYVHTYNTHTYMFIYIHKHFQEAGVMTEWLWACTALYKGSRFSYQHPGWAAVSPAPAESTSSSELLGHHIQIWPYILQHTYIYTWICDLK